MEVTVENTGRLERRMRVEVPESRIEGEVSDRLKSMTRTARIPGFRPGKVPLKVVAQRFGRQVREEVVGQVMRSSFLDALQKENLRPAGSPVIDPVDAQPGKGLAYTAVFEIYPEVPAPKVDGAKILKPVAGVTDADVDRMIETLRRQRRTWTPVERASRTGDRVVIDFEGTIEGEPFEGNKGGDVPVDLGSGRMLPGFESGLEGAKTGDAPILEVKFPDDYAAEQLAGRTASFAVRVKTVQEPLLPQVDEEFAQSFGVKEGGVEGLRAEIRNNLQRELDDAVRGRIKQRVMDKLLELNPVEPPQSLVEQEQHRMFHLRQGELAHQGLDPARLGLEPGMFAEQSRRRIALGLLLAELVKSNGLAADADRVRARIEGIASTYEDPKQVVSWYYADQARLAEVESAVLEDQVVDWVLQRVQIEEERTSFDELLNPGQTTEEEGPGAPDEARGEGSSGESPASGG